MTRRHVYDLHRVAHAVRGHVELRTRRGALVHNQDAERARFARVVTGEPVRLLAVPGWRRGPWVERTPGEWVAECWPVGVTGAR